MTDDAALLTVTKTSEALGLRRATGQMFNGRKLTVTTLHQGSVNLTLEDTVRGAIARAQGGPRRPPPPRVTGWPR